MPRIVQPPAFPMSRSTKDAGFYFLAIRNWQRAIDNETIEFPQRRTIPIISISGGVRPPGKGGQSRLTSKRAPSSGFAGYSDRMRRLLLSLRLRPISTRPRPLLSEPVSGVYVNRKGSEQLFSNHMRDGDAPFTLPDALNLTTKRFRVAEVL